jgi:ABC-type amino acid transport substrate-binding protein
MRTFFLLFMSIISMHYLFGQTFTGDTWSQVKSKGSGTISLTYVETPSFVYKDKAQKLTGICVDIMNDFVVWVNQSKKIKLESKFVGNGESFHGMYENVKNASGGVYGLGNITITEERKKEIKFSQPIITNFAILVSNNNVPTLTKLEDISTTFANMTAYTAKGTLNEKRILDLKQKYYPNMKITYTTTSQETLEKIFADPHGFAYLDLAFYLEAVQIKKNIQRHPVGDKAAEKFGFIMPNNSDWTSVFDEFFSSNGGYLNSPTYKNILLKHLGNTGVKLLNSVTK